MNNNTSHGNDDDDKSESDDDNKRKKLSKFLDDKKLECAKCIVKLKRKNKKIKIICYSLLTLSVVGQTVASIVAPMLVPPLVITGITGTTAFATALSGQLKFRGQKSKIDSKIRELNVIKNKIQFLEAINGGFSEESIEEIFQYWNHKKMADYWGRPHGNGAVFATKSELNTSIAKCVKKTGDTMTGALNMSKNKITSLGTPTASGDAATKGYTDNKYVAKTGDTMTGDFILSNNGATTRILGCNDLTGANQFRLRLGSPVDAIIHQPTFPVFIHGSNGVQILSNGVENALFGQSSTDARIGFFEDLIMNSNKITNLANPTSAQDAATKNYADGYIDSVFKVVYVSSTGSDTNGAGSITNPYATLGAAIAGIDGSGWKVAVMPGTYTENITTGLQNVTIESYLLNLFEMGAIINIAETLTLTHTASSIRLIGITATNIAHTGAGSLYMVRCRTNTNFATSGGYVEMTDCDTQGGAGTGTLTISGTASRVIRGGYAGIITHTNATTSINGQINCAPITHTSGKLALGIGTVYAATGTSNALSSAAGTVIIDGTTFLTPTNTNARINIAAGVIYQIVSAKYDKANSTINGTATVINPTYYSISDPTISTEPATKNYVDTITYNGFKQVAPTNMTANNAPTPYIASSVNGQAAATLFPYKAFDGDPSTYWATNGGGVNGSLTIYLGDQYVVTRIYIDH
jgi:hypothetical protein